MDPQEQGNGPDVSQARVVFGLVVMLIGAMLLVDRLHWWGFRLNVPLWPWILVLLGLAKLGDKSARARGPWPANWLLLLGVWGLVNEYQLFGLHYEHSWPLLIVAVGVLIVWRSTNPGACTPARRNSEPRFEKPES